MIGVYLLIEMVRQLVSTGDASWIFLILVSVLFFGFGIPFVCEEPTGRDVLKGNAHYVIVTHEDNERDIITYDIEWNNKKIHPW
jgi:hypothetical protein